MGGGARAHRRSNQILHFLGGEGGGHGNTDARAFKLYLVFVVSILGGGEASGRTGTQNKCYPKIRYARPYAHVPRP